MPSRTVLDWMAALGIPLLLVVGGYLGTISHTLTALDVLAQRHLTIAAIVVSESERNPVELDDTVASIARFAQGAGVVGLPRLPAGINEHPAFAQDRRVDLSKTYFARNAFDEADQRRGRERPCRAGCRIPPDCG